MPKKASAVSSKATIPKQADPTKIYYVAHTKVDGRDVYSRGTVTVVKAP